MVPQIQENLKYWQELDKRKPKINHGKKSLPPPKSPKPNRRSVATSNGTIPKSPKKPKSDNSMKRSNIKKDKKDKKDKKEKKEKKGKKEKKDFSSEESPKERSGPFSLKFKAFRERKSKGGSLQFTLRNR